MENKKFINEDQFGTSGVVSKTHKFKFRAKDGYQLGSKTACPMGRYYKYSDGKNWSEFTREELEYMATQSCADIPQYKIACSDEERTKMPQQAYERQSLEHHKDLRQIALEQAGKLQNNSLQELLANAEKIMRWLVEK